MNQKVFMTSVAGINFRATPEDLGPALGYVERDLNNEHDPRAVGVYRSDGSLLGYVASKDLDEFYKFKGEGFDKMVFTGNIKKVKSFGKEFYVGNIAILRTEDETELTELANKFLLDDNFILYGKTAQE